MVRQILSIIPVDRKRCQVTISTGESFPLYQGEIRGFQFEEGGEIPDAVWEELDAALRKRVRLRCMHLLQKADKTERQLRQKLKEGGYPPFLVDDALDYVKSYHYVDDERYARYYVQQQSAGKSRLRLKQDLQTKGVPEEIIRLVLEEEEVDEEASLRKLAQKKVASVRPQTPVDWQKISRYLAGKGYGFSTIRHVIGQLQDEAEDAFCPEQ